MSFSTPPRPQGLSIGNNTSSLEPTPANSTKRTPKLASFIGLKAADESPNAATLGRKESGDSKSNGGGTPGQIDDHFGPLFVSPSSKGGGKTTLISGASTPQPTKSSAAARKRKHDKLRRRARSTSPLDPVASFLGISARRRNVQGAGNADFGGGRGGGGDHQDSASYLRDVEAEILRPTELQIQRQHRLKQIYRDLEKQRVKGNKVLHLEKALDL